MILNGFRDFMFAQPRSATQKRKMFDTEAKILRPPPGGILCSKFGNLLQRAIVLTQKYYGGKVCPRDCAPGRGHTDIGLRDGISAILVQPLLVLMTQTNGILNFGA